MRVGKAFLSELSGSFHLGAASAAQRNFRRLCLVLAALAAVGSGIAVSQVPVAIPGQTAVGKQAVAVPVVVRMTAAGSGAVTTAVTQGVSGLDFSLAAGSACDASASYQVGSLCTVSVVFGPLYPGQRNGAVVVTDGSGRLLGETLLSGSATGSLAVLAPGDINTVAGDGELLYRGDNVGATSTPVYLPQGVVADAAGNLYISDTENNRIRRVDAKSGLISTFAGTGAAGYSGDGGASTAAMIQQPSGLVLDGAGNLYFADSGNDVVRRVDAISGVITTVAGTPTKQGYAGDGAAATLASLSGPHGLAFDASGNLYIADTGNNVVRVVNAATQNISTKAGTGVGGYNGDGQLATAAQLNTPWSVCVGPDGSLYIADLSNNLVRRVSPGGVIGSVAGTGVRGFSGDGGTAISAALNDPAAVALNPAGDLYIADSGNNRVRRVSRDGGIATITGNASEQFAGDGGPQDQASLYAPYALYFDQSGDLLLSDMLHNRIRMISATPTQIAYPDMKVGKTSAPAIQGLENDGNDNLLLSTPVFVNAALDNGTTTCSFGVAITPDGTCTLGVEFQPTVTGTPVHGTFTLPSNAGNAPTVMNLQGNVLSVDPVTVTLTSSLNPSLVGVAVTFTAAIASDDPNVSGPVTFLDGTTPICSNIALSGGRATCTTSTLTLGQHSITASYAGDANNEAKVSAALIQTVQQTPTVTLAATPNPAVVTNSVSITVTVTAPSGTPTGTVILYDGTTAITGNLTLTNGAATFTTTQLAPGSHQLNAQYAGDTNDAAAPSNSVIEVITQAATTTTLATSNANPFVGTAITLTATATSTIGSTLSGTVTFSDGSTVLGTQTLGSNGIAAITISTLAPGSHAIVAAFSGDKNDSGSSSIPLVETVQQIPTGTTLTTSANTLSAGATVQLTATVAISGSEAADGTIMGTVTFTDGSATLGTAQVDVNGLAALTVVLPAGSQSVVATYAGNTNYTASTSNAVTETVNTTATTTTLSGSASSILSGKPVTFTAVVGSSTGTPTGSVTFTDGGTILSVSPLNAGVATFTTSSLSVGTHSIVATYGGDSNYITSKSLTISEVVSLASTSLSLAGPATANVTTTVTLTGTLTSTGVTPTGPLTLLDGGLAIGTQNVGASGSFSFATSTLSIGTHTLTVSYGGDSNNSSSVSAALTLVVTQASTTTSLSSSANPSTLGQPVTLTAGVTSAITGITGSVSFYDGGTLLGSTAVVNGSASFTTSSLTFGSHNLTAVYAGDTNHATSTSVAVAEQIVEAATASLSSSVNPATSGTNVVFTARLAPIGSLIPTGSVVFHDGAGALGTATLDGTGAATFATSTLAVGSHAISFTYAGDSNYAATSATLTETIQNANTQVALTASANPAVYGAALSLTATLTTNGGVATGTVTFSEGTTTIGSAILNGSGVATLTTTTLAPGVHNLVANYAGDGKASASVSTPLTISVLETTSTAVASSANPALTLSSIVLTATVTNSVGQPTGTVTFTDGSTLLGKTTVGANGVATLPVPSLSAGTHPIVVSYSGDGNNSPSQSAAMAQVVQLRPTTTTVTATQTNAANPQQVTLIAVVHYTGTTPATGSVTFTNGANTLGSSPVDATGVATLTVVLQTSKEDVVAAYSGDTAYAASSSPITTITGGTATQFTLTLNPSSMNMPSKQHGTATLTIASLSGFSDTLELGCLGLPYAATCTFSTTQSKLAANGTSVVQLTVDTGDPLGSGATAGAGFGDGRTLLLTLPLTLLLSFGLWRIRGKRSKAPVLLLMAFAAGLILSTTGCAGLTTNGTPAGTYTFYVTAAGQGSGATQSKAVTLTVTQ